MSQSVKTLISIVVLIVAVGLLVLVAQKDRQTSEGPIRIGVIGPLTGPFADYGEDIRDGVLAVEVGEGVEFVFEDDQCDAKSAVAAFQKLTSIDGVKFIIGPGCGSPQEAVAPLLAGSDVIGLLPSAASQSLFEQSGGHYFNVQYSLEDESAFIADEMYRRGYTTVALVSYGNAFSSAHAASFREHYQGEIIYDEVLTDDNAGLLTEFTKIRAAGAQALYSPDLTFFFGGGLAKMEQLGLTIPVFSTYVAELPAAAPLTEGVYYSFPEGITGDRGAAFGLSKESLEILMEALGECGEDTECVGGELLTSGAFSVSGVSTRGMLLKQIKDGAPQTLQ